MRDSPPQLDALLSPRSIAVVGASGDRRKNSGKPLNFLKEHGYAGKVFPINPRYPDLLGWRCYPSVGAVQEPIDLAVITVPAEQVPSVLRECGENGVRGAVILTSGFSEVGAEGRAAEKELVGIAEKYGVRFCGPNSVGIINAHERAIASFSQAADQKAFKPGGMALISQSGNFGTYMIELAARRGIYFSHFVSTGNEADLDLLDYAEYLIKDPRVKIIVGYVEGFRDVTKLSRVGELARTLRKAIVLVKVGRSQAGARSAMSHTGALVGDDMLYQVAFRQAGVIRANNEEEVLDMLPLLVADNHPRGGRVGIVSISGGGATIMADACEDAGLSVSEFNDETKETLRGIVPYFGMVSNPVDLTGQVLSEGGLMQKCLAAVLKDDNVDSVVLFLSLMERMGPMIAREILDAATGEKPVVVSWIAGPAASVQKLRDAGLCVTTQPSTACATALGQAVKFAQWIGDAAAVPERPRSLGAAIRAPAGPVNAKSLSGAEARELLSAWGIPTLAYERAESVGAVAGAADRIGYPVALKLDEPFVAHKTEVGAIRLNVVNRKAANVAAEELFQLGRRIDSKVEPRILIEKMGSPGVELLLSLRRDQHFGATLNVGMGGIFAELYRDVATRILPVDDSALDRMVRELKASAVLEGYRGQPPSDIGAVSAALHSLALVAKDNPAINLVEINPFIVWPQGRGGAAADALIVTEQKK